jgi:hypothetical protein
LFHAIGSTFTELCKQVQESIQLLLPFSAHELRNELPNQ